MKHLEFKSETLTIVSLVHDGAVVLHLGLIHVDKVLKGPGLLFQLGLQRTELVDQLVRHLQRFQAKGQVPANTQG